MVKSIEDLLLEACEIRDAEDEKENTALRVGTMLVNLLESLGTYVDLATLREVLESYAQINSLGLTVWHQSRVVPLVSMGSDLDNVDGGDWAPTMSPGDIRYNPSGNRLELTTSSGIEIWTCRPGVIYVNMHSMRLYAWSNAGMTELSDDHTQRRVIADMHCTDLNEQEVGTVGYYPSTKRLIYKYADRGWLRLQIDANAIYGSAADNTVLRWDPINECFVTMGDNQGGGSVTNIIDDMESAAANSTQSVASSRAVKEIYINLKQLYQNLAGIAFIGTKPTWQSVGKQTYNISLASADTHITLTDINGNSVDGPQNEGSSLTLVLSVASGYRFVSAPTAMMGQEQLTVVKDSNGYVIYVDALTDNIVINASSVAIGYYGVTIPAGSVFCTASGTESKSPSIAEGEDLLCYIRPSDGKRWLSPPSSNDADVTLHSGDIYIIEATNLNKNITVNGSVEDIPIVAYTVAVPNTPHITVDDGNGDSVPASIQQGGNLTIRMIPDSGYNIVIESATMGSQNLVPTNDNGVLTFVIENVSGNISILAHTQQQVITRQISVVTSNLTPSSLIPVSVLNGNPLSITLNVPNNLHVVDDENLSVMMGSQPLDVTQQGNSISYGEGYGSVTIEIAQVTGDVVISADAITYVDEFEVNGVTASHLKFHVDCKNGVTLDNGTPTEWRDLVGDLRFALTDVEVDSEDGGLIFNGTTSLSTPPSGVNMLSIPAASGTAEGVFTSEDSLGKAYLLSNNNNNNNLIILGVGEKTSGTNAPASGSGYPSKACMYLQERLSVSQATTAMCAGHLIEEAPDGYSGEDAFTWQNVSYIPIDIVSVKSSISVRFNSHLYNGRVLSFMSNTNPSASSATTVLAIGCRQGKSAMFHHDGKIYNIRVYDTQLSVDQQLHNYNIDKKRFGLS